MISIYMPRLQHEVSDQKLRMSDLYAPLNDGIYYVLKEPSQVLSVSRIKP